MPALITFDEALRLGEQTDRDEIMALVERAWAVRRENFGDSTDMCPIEAQRFRLVCSATSFAPASTFSKSRFESPWPWVTMQKRCAPAASAARACSSICSGSIIACIGVSASA